MSPPRASAASLLISHFDFNGDPQDVLRNSPPMDLLGVSMTNNSLLLPLAPEAGFFTASARIPNLSYNSFTIALDFNPARLLYPQSTFLIGGPATRWISFEAGPGGQLLINLNNGNWRYAFTNILATNQWHTLVCAVDILSQRMVTFLDGEALPETALPGFQFEVVGTEFEESDKIFSFWNYRNASYFSGSADNLRVYRRALSPAEIHSLLAARVDVKRFESAVLVSWPADLSGYVLESASSIQSPMQWLTENRPPVLVGDHFLVVDIPGRDPRFYRLRRNDSSRRAVVGEEPTIPTTGSGSISPWWRFQRSTPGNDSTRTPK